MKVLILGGDGYLGWPTAMDLSLRGHEVHLVDNYLRRRVHTEAGSGSLTPIAPDLETRVTAWHEVTGATITMTEGDLTEWSVVEQAFRDFPPDALFLYGDIPVASYSMLDRARSVLTHY